MDIMIAVAVGVFLLVAWTVGGWAIVRMGFTRDGDAARAPAHDDGVVPRRGGHASSRAKQSENGSSTWWPNAGTGR